MRIDHLLSGTVRSWHRESSGEPLESGRDLPDPGVFQAEARAPATLFITMSTLRSAPLDSMDGRAPFSLRYAPGHRIADKYQLIRTLEQGGMGVVWVAHHLDLDVQVA